MINLTSEEKTYLEIYRKGIEAKDYLVNWKGNLNIYYEGCYLVQLEHNNINAFINFLNNPQDKDLRRFVVRDLDIIIQMIKCVSCVASKYAAENFGITDISFYRYENVDNIPSYQTGHLCSFKSSSISKDAVEIFNDGSSRLLEYEVDGFCPYIPINEVTDMSVLNDEHEYLFPPYLGCYVEGDKVKIFVSNDENLDGDELTEEEKDAFVRQLLNDQKSGIVSDRLKAYCEKINDYLKREVNKIYKAYYGQKEREGK